MEASGFDSHSGAESSVNWRTLSARKLIYFRSASAIGIETHPRDLNLMFVAYSGNFWFYSRLDSMLTSFKRWYRSDAPCELPPTLLVRETRPSVMQSERSLLKTFQYTLSPGAPGGYGYDHPVNFLTTSSYTATDLIPTQALMSFRYPLATCVSMHPTGHIFAVGHEDGSITFWATEDEDRPLLVRTLDDIDVNLVEGEKVPDPGSELNPPTSFREPIFKLAWSGFPNSDDPRGGPTVLTILGGLNATDEPGINVIQLPAFNPPEPPSSPGLVGLHPFFRQAMRESLMPINAHFYPSTNNAVIQDFLLVPRSSPHFSGNWDPLAVLIIAEAKAGTRAIEAYQFPPPGFAMDPSNAAPATSTQAGTGASDTDNEVMQQLTSALDSITISAEPSRLTIPSPYWSGAGAVTNGNLVKVENDNYKQLLNQPDSKEILLFNGGIAGIETLPQGAASRMVDVSWLTYETSISCGSYTLYVVSASPALGDDP
jgi:syntaxin-binding protein 5